MIEWLHDDALAAHRPVVRALVAQVLGHGSDRADVEDCTSEAFRRALEGRTRLSPGAAVRPWLLGIARHVALDARRARTRARQRAAVGGRDDEREAIDQLAATGPDPHTQVELDERQTRLRVALDTLPEEQRRALALHAEGKRYREIAAQLSVPLGTVCTWIARARTHVAHALQEHNDHEAPP